MNKKTAKEQRHVWPDLIRIIAIYLVIVVHISIVPKSLSSGSLPTFALYAIAKTCVPLFVMLSGALLLSKQETYPIFFKKRLLRIVLPWITWTCIYTIFYLSTMKDISAEIFIQTFKEALLSFWFIPMIVGLYLLTPSMRIFVQHAKQEELFFIIVLWFFVISFLPFTRDSLAFPRHVDNSLLRQIISYSGYFLLGYFLTLFRPFSRFFLFSFLLTGLGLLWTVDAVFGQSLFNHGTLVESYFNYISPSMVILSLGLFSLLILLGDLLENVCSSSQKFWIQTVSTAALGIYFVEFWVQQVVEKIYTRHPVSIFIPGLNNMVNGLFLFALSFVVIYVLQKIPFVRRFIA